MNASEVDEMSVIDKHAANLSINFSYEHSYNLYTPATVSSSSSNSSGDNISDIDIQTSETINSAAESIAMQMPQYDLHNRLFTSVCTLAHAILTDPASNEIAYSNLFYSLANMSVKFINLPHQVQQAMIQFVENKLEACGKLAVSNVICR